MVDTKAAEVEYCDCDWFDQTECGIMPCECGDHDIRMYRDTVVHWQGKHYRFDCYRYALGLAQGRREAARGIFDSMCRKCRDGDEPTQPFGPEVSTWYHCAKPASHGYGQCLATEIRTIVAGMEKPCTI